ncbi:MAG: EamA family transporter [Aldersonia sp.]|nr:EamA family transporter [Aldersonia sp.]
MTGWLFALGSAVLYGVSDFVGGLASRRAHFVLVALLGQVAGVGVAAGVSLLVAAPSLDIGDLGWGALSGLGTAAGMVFLFRGLSHGSMSVVVPTSALTGMSLPVLAGVVLEDQQPTALAWLGIAVAMPALWLVSDSRSPAGTAGAAGMSAGLIAGLGIAVQYLSLAQASAGSGMWPVTAGRVSAVCVLVPTMLVATRRGRTPASRQQKMQPASRLQKIQLASRLRGTPPAFGMPPTSLSFAALSGATAAAALAAYLLATHHEITAIAVVLSSLYPVIPVLLGITVLHEKLTPRQTVGLLAAAPAAVLLAT